MKTFQQFLDEAVKLPLYHGTASYNVDSIQEYGLESTNEPYNLYFTTNPAIALREAYYTVYGDPHGKNNSDWDGGGDPPEYLLKAKPVVIKVDRQQVKNLKHDPEYLKGSKVRADAFFVTDQIVPPSAIQEVIEARTRKGKSRLRQLYQDFLKATKATDHRELETVYSLITQYR